MQGVIKSYDPGTGDGVVMGDTDRAEYDLAARSARRLRLSHAATGPASGFTLGEEGRAARSDRLRSRHGLHGLPDRPGRPGLTSVPSSETTTSETRLCTTTSNTKLQQWVDEWAEILQPDSVHWCDGSERSTTASAASSWTGARSSASTRNCAPTATWRCPDPGDVARVEDRTFICSEREADAGTTNNWRPPAEMKAELLDYQRAPCGAAPCTSVPFSMERSVPIAHIGVERC